MMFGFAAHRRQLLDGELRRMAAELPALGVLRAYLAGDLAAGTVTPESGLELVLVQDTDEPFHRRADFFMSHLRPRAATEFVVYTPVEFERCAETDPYLIAVLTKTDAIA